MMKCIINIERLVYNGFGMGRTADGMVVFVPYTAPGDRVLAEITQKKRDFAFAEVLEILEPSPHRVSPECPHFGSCGSCQWLHVDYETQKEQKLLILERELKRHLRQPVKPESMLVSSPRGYRRRARLFVERRLLGFKAARSNRIIPVGRCPLLTEGLNRALLVLYRFQGLLRRGREVLLGEDIDGKRLLVSVTAEGKIREIHEILHALKGETGKEVGLCISYRGKRSLLGPRHLEEEILGATVRYGHHCFFQANRFLLRDLVRLVVEQVPEGSRVLELFAGCGTFTLPLASSAAEVVAVEGNPVSCRMLEESAKQQGFSNIRVINADCSRFLQDEGGSFDVVVLDPPRTGCTPQVLDWIAQSKAQRVIYVSCNPSTLARDISRLKGYRVTKVVPIDMFPNTFHLETVCLLEGA